MVDVQVVDKALTHQVEGGHLIIVRLIRVDLKLFHEVLEHSFVWLSNDEVHSVTLAVGTVLSKDLFSIDLIESLLTIVNRYISKLLHHTHTKWSG